MKKFDVHVELENGDLVDFEAADRVELLTMVRMVSIIKGNSNVCFPLERVHYYRIRDVEVEE